MRVVPSHGADLNSIFFVLCKNVINQWQLSKTASSSSDFYFPERSDCKLGFVSKISIIANGTAAPVRRLQVSEVL